LTFYEEIVATTKYLDQISVLSLPIQELIGRASIEVASHEGPIGIGKTDTCGEQTSPNVLVIFPGLDQNEKNYTIDKL
jgi:hypothetical protein